MEGFLPMLKQTALSKEPAPQKEYQIWSQLPLPVTPTILHVIPVTFGILDLLASAGKCSGDAELFKCGRRRGWVEGGRGGRIGTTA